MHTCTLTCIHTYMHTYISPLQLLAPSGILLAGTHVGGVISFGLGAISFTHVLKATEPVWAALISAIFFRDFLPLPVYLSLVPISELTLTLTPPLTHILRQHGSAGCDGDCMSLGRWVDGGVGEVGNWSAAVGVPDEPMLIDAGAYYASKDFWDGATGRRINWGW